MFTPQITSIAVAAANEGIPVGAIARILKEPMGDVYDVLNDEKSRGAIASMPRADWPPGARVSDRLPSVALPTDDDLAFLCKKAFKLTGLEAGFLVILLKHRQAEKTRLHHIVEQQRMIRRTQPNTREETDPKMVDVMICKLRKKLLAASKAFTIETIWGGGYYVETPVKTLILAFVNGEPDATQTAPIANGIPGAATH